MSTDSADTQKYHHKNIGYHEGSHPGCDGWRNIQAISAGIKVSLCANELRTCARESTSDLDAGAGWVADGREGSVRMEVERVAAGGDTGAFMA